MEPKFYWLLVGILGVWRVTHLLQAEDGPFDSVVWLRSRASGFWGNLLDCFYCLSLWVSLPFACICGDTISEYLLLWPALSAGAILVERVTDYFSIHAQAEYFEDKIEDKES